jgi:dihydrofolate reductase
MGSIVVICNLTLDGVMQAPGHPEEDPRGGFEHGGWATPYSSDAMGRVMAERSGRKSALLFGRLTYQRFAAFWPQQPDNPFTDVLNRMQKYVASTTLTEPLPWQNSTLLPVQQGDAREAIATLKQDRPDHDLVVLGSGALIGSLMERELLDEFTLLIHPLVLGSGRRLFPDGVPGARFELTGSSGTTTGVVICTYHSVAGVGSD